MNIILIVADDLGWNDVGYHSNKIQTPTIDYLAMTGLRIEKSYCYSVCTPTRAAIVTGNCPHRYGLQGVLWPWNYTGLDINAYLLSNFLKDNGYSTYLVGKWHLGNQKHYQPHHRGYDYHFGLYNGMFDYWNHTYYNIHDLQENGKPVHPNGHSTDLFTNKAIEIIENHDTTKPMFLHLCYNAVHVPLQPGAFADYYSRIQPNKNRRDYCALVSQMDFGIGQILAKLASRKMLNDTLIWFLSDNGGWLPGGANNAPFRGEKATRYEGGIRNVNFINYGKLNSGEIFQGSCHVIDIFPTIAALIGKPIPIQTDGINIFDPNAQDRPFIAFLLDYEMAIIYKNWKYLKLVSGDELYDLQNDPLETKNVINNNKEIADNLRQILETRKCEKIPEIHPWHKPNGYPPGFKFPKYAGDEITPMFLATTPPQPKTFAELVEHND